MAVKLVVANQKGYVWDLEDIQTLRVQHHICGVLSGTLPQVGQQNVFLGIPLVLLPEEVVLLVRNKLAHIVDDPAAHTTPSQSQVDSYHASRNGAIEAQQKEAVRYAAEKKAKMNEVYKEQIEKRRLEKEAKKKKAMEASVKEGAKGESFELFVPDLKEGASTTGLPTTTTTTSQAPTSQEASPVNLSSIAYTIFIQASSTDFPWYDPDAASYTSIESATLANVWNYPTTPLQESRCKVFEDLWRKGYFIGGGLRFGGDFLIYPGDPLRYHSHFTLTVLESPKTPIMPLDLVAYGRLATAVKKAHLLASWDQESDTVIYSSLEWAAMG